MKKNIYLSSIMATVLLANISAGSTFVNTSNRCVYAMEVNDQNISLYLPLLQNFLNSNSFSTIMSQMSTTQGSKAIGLLTGLTSSPIFTCSADNVLRVNSSAISSIVTNCSAKYPNAHLTESQVSGVFNAIANAFNGQPDDVKESTKNLLSSYCIYEQPVPKPEDPVVTPTDPTTKPADSNTDPQKPADSNTDPTKSADPNTDSTKPVDPNTNPAKPADSNKTPTDPADSQKPATDSPKSTDNTKGSDATQDKKPEDTKTVSVLNFSDVDKDSWAREAIEYLSSKNILKGIDKEGTKFNPKGNITRAEFITIIVRALNLQSEQSKGTFKDVVSSKWYADSVETASKYNIINGDESGKFNPEKSITREEIAKIIVTAYEVKTGKSTKELLESYKDGKISDISQASKWASDYIKIASLLGIANGNNLAQYMPKNTATREEIAKMVYNLITNIATN